MFNALFATKIQAKYLFLAAVGLLAPIKSLMILVGLFILIDTVLGIWAAKRQKIKITSNKLSAVLSKMFVYQGIVILAYIIDVNIMGGIINIFIDSVPLLLTKVVTLMVIVNESFSVDEKIRILNEEKGFWFYFKRALGVAKVLKKETKDLLGDLNKDDKPKLDKDDKGELIG